MDKSMGILLKTGHLKCYKDIAWLLIKYGNSDLVKNAGLEEVLTRQEQLPILQQMQMN